MPALSPDLLARVREVDPKEMLREDLEDALKEYNELDCLVEILQNALDAIDYRRYALICEAANRDPQDVETIDRWNQAVLEGVRNDYDRYAQCQTSAQKAVFYQEALDDNERRSAWWETLAEHMGSSPENLEAATATYQPDLRITVRIGPPAWIEVEDNGIGMSDIPSYFRHKSSTKRSSTTVQRRLGNRGSHGWGLTAILAMSNRVEIISKVNNDPPEAYAFSNYASFVRGGMEEPSNEQIDLHEEGHGTLLSQRLRNAEDATGTHFRVQLANLDSGDLLGNTLQSYAHEKFINLLRLYTPVGQVNDFLLHPAYHNVRKSDITVNVTSVIQGHEESSNVDFDILRLSDGAIIPSFDFNNFVNAGWPENVSVHTVHRSLRGGHVYLSAAEIQPASLAHTVEDRLIHRGVLSGYVDDNDRFVAEIPRGFFLAFSGGMKSEYLVRPPRSASAAFRGFILSETARPTLGRKYVMDQRRSIPRAASEHESKYDDVRRKVLPTAIPPIATPAAARWRREFFQTMRDEILNQTPLSNSLMIWAGRESREARVMMLFSEILQLNLLGNFRVLRVHLRDKYDFTFLYSDGLDSEDAPNAPVVEELRSGGYLMKISQSDEFYRYGLGEFKARGDAVFDDFDEDTPRKSADAIDLLVCWGFDAEIVADEGWLVEEVTDINREFRGQTHAWRPSGSERRRSRLLPVISLKHLIEDYVEDGILDSPPEPWPEILPEVYF